MSDLQPTTNEAEEKGRKRREPGSGCLIPRGPVSPGIGAHKSPISTAKRFAVAE